MDNLTEAVEGLSKKVETLTTIIGKIANTLQGKKLEKEMALERRADIGSKVTVSILLSMIALLLGMFFNSVYGMAKDANTCSSTNTKDIAVLQKSFSG